MVKIKHFPDCVVSIFERHESGVDNFIGICRSEASFDHLRVQIKEQKINNIYCQFEGRDYNIDSYGRIHDWPKGLYDAHVKFLRRLLA